MIRKSNSFDALVASVINGTPHSIPKVACSYRIKGYSVHIEANLSTYAKAMRVFERLERPNVRYFYPNAPVKRIRGPLCLISLLMHARIVDLFCVEVHGGMVALAVYSNDPKAAYRLIDEVISAVSV